MFEWIKDRFDRLKLPPTTNTWQKLCAVRLAEAVRVDAERKMVYTGSILYSMLPNDLAPQCVKAWFDPYNRQLDRACLYHWITTHIRFDDEGKIVEIIEGEEPDGD